MLAAGVRSSLPAVTAAPTRLQTGPAGARQAREASYDKGCNTSWHLKHGGLRVFAVSNPRARSSTVAVETIPAQPRGDESWRHARRQPWSPPVLRILRVRERLCRNRCTWFDRLSRRCQRLCRAPPLVHPLAHFLAHLEEGQTLGLDGNDCACARVATVIGPVLALQAVAALHPPQNQRLATSLPILRYRGSEALPLPPGVPILGTSGNAKVSLSNGAAAKNVERVDQ
jgi:hypothetical protein